MAGVNKRLTDEAIEFLEDKIARLKANGQLEEVADAEEQLARMKARTTSDPLTPIREPEVPVKALDATDWNAPLKPSADEARGMLAADLSSVPGEQVEQVGQATIRRKIPGRAMAGAGVAGAGIATSLGTDDVNSLPPSPSSEEEPQEMAMAAKGEAPGGAYTKLIQAPEIKDMLASLGEPPARPDLTRWDSDIGKIRDERQNRINDLKNDILQAKATAEAATSSVERRELIETITNAIGQMAAGFYGLKHGLDLSGAKFNKTDWNAKLDQIRAKMKDDIALLTEEQQLDQAVISERKEDLLRRKDDLVKSFGMDLQRYAQKADALAARQGVENTKASMQFHADRFNEEMRIRSEEAVRKAAKEGKSAKDQVGAGLKANLLEQDKILDQWSNLASEANSDKLNDDQKRALLARMEDLDRRYAASRGYPIIASDTNPLTPMSYSELDADEVAEKAANRFVAQDTLIQKVGGFRNKRALDYVQHPEKYMATFAQSAVDDGMNPIAAAEYAQKEYVKGMQLMFDQQRKYEESLGGK